MAGEITFIRAVKGAFAASNLISSAGLTEGNEVLLLVANARVNGITIPSGFTLIKDFKGTSGYNISHKTITGSEPANYDVLYDAGTFTRIMLLFEIENFDGIDVIDETDVFKALDADATAPSVTATTASSILFTTIVNDAAGTTITVPPSQFELWNEESDAGSSPHSVASSFEVLTATGATGTRLIERDGAGAETVALNLIIKLAVAGGDINGTLASTLDDVISAAEGTVEVDLLADRYFSNLDGVAQYFVIPSYTGTITMDVYPLVDGTGLPTGAPVVTTFEWNTIAFAVTALTDIGKNGASFFTGLIANISGTALDVPVKLETGIEAPASLGATQSETILCEDTDGDWIEVDNNWTQGDINTAISETLGIVATQNDLLIGYEYAAGAESDNINMPWNMYLFRYGQHVLRSVETGKFSNAPRNYLAASNANTLNFELVDNAESATTVIRVSRAFKQTITPGDYRFIFVSGQSLSIGAGSSDTAQHRLPIDDTFRILAMGYDRPQFADKTLDSFVGLRDYTELTSNTHNWALLNSLKADAFTGKLVLSGEGTSSSTVLDLAYSSDSAASAAQALKELPVPTGVVTGSIVWIQGEADQNNANFETYKSDLRALQDDYITKVGVQYPSITAMNMILDQTGGADNYFNIARTLWEYSVENADAFLAMPKYHINGRWPASAGDHQHLSALGYDIQGEYIARALHAVEYGGGTWQPLEPISASYSGNEVTINFHVPVGNLVVDTTSIAAAVAHGITFERPASGGTVVPLSVVVNSDNIVIDIGESGSGGTVEFGHNATLVNGKTHPITNIRDEDTAIGADSGENLYNWLVISSIAVAQTFSLDDVNGDETTTDGEVGVTLTLTDSPTLDGFSVQGVGGSPFLSGGNISGSNGAFTVDLFSVKDGDFPSFQGMPFSSANWMLEYEAQLGAEVSVLPATHNPAAGWAIVDVLSATAAVGSIFEGRTGLPNDTSQIYYPTAGNTTIDPDGTIFTDLTDVVGRMYNSDTGVEESWNFVVA